MNATRWVLAAVLWCACVTGASTGSSPLVLEPLTNARMPIREADGFARSYGQSLSMTPDGQFIALARYPGVVDIWSIQTGAKTATLRLSSAAGERAAHAVLVGPGCVAVAGAGWLLGPTPQHGDASVGFWDCETGKLVAKVATGIKGDFGALTDVVALHSCGLAVAQYADRVVVIDVAKRILVQDLSRLFDGPMLSAVRSYPPTAPSNKVYMRMGVSPSTESCKVFAVVDEFNTHRRTRLPSKLYEFDLRTSRVWLIRSLSDDLDSKLDWDRGTISFAVSPSEAFTALFLRSHQNNETHLVLTDVHQRGQTKTFRLRDSRTVSDPAFLTDQILLSSTTWWMMAANVDAMLFNHRTEQMHTLCSGEFGEPDIEKGNPRAIAVNTKAGFLGVSLRDEVRAYKYRINPTGIWNGSIDCVDD